MATRRPVTPRNDRGDVPVAGPPAYFEWANVRWYRRPNTGHYADRTGGMLHVAIWEHVNRRRLPDGFVVHHIDENPANNEPSNLQAMDRVDHLREHGLVGRPQPREVR